LDAAFTDIQDGSAYGMLVNQEGEIVYSPKRELIGKSFNIEHFSELESKKWLSN
jgi:two-component system sensor histidine kinase YesM